MTSATDDQVINDVSNVTQNPCFYVMLRNGVEPRNETFHSHSRRFINDRQSVSAT